jgi:hypothetical protein
MSRSSRSDIARGSLAADGAHGDGVRKVDPAGVEYAARVAGEQRGADAAGPPADSPCGPADRLPHRHVRLARSELLEAVPGQHERRGCRGRVPCCT